MVDLTSCTMKVISLIFILITLPDAVNAISCLVMRPGHGLVTEECPSGTVGCRINVRTDKVDWYEWSKLYDRNQLVCVYPGEYNGTAGCVRKISGDVRCWCSEQNNCNDEKTSRELLHAFQSSDKTIMEAIIRRLKFGERVDDVEADDAAEGAGAAMTATATDDGNADNYDEGAEEEKITTTPTTTTTTTTTSVFSSTTRPPTRRVTHKKHHIVQKTMTSTPKTTVLTTSATTTTMEETIENELETKKLPSPYRTQFGDEFDETRKKLLEEIREEDERLQQLLADEEAEMIAGESDSIEDEREEQRRIERERNRMERRERARADERRRQTEEETLRKRERAQKHKEMLRKDDENSDQYHDRTSTTTLSSSFTVLIMSSLSVVLRF